MQRSVLNITVSQYEDHSCISLCVFWPLLLTMTVGVNFGLRMITFIFWYFLSNVCGLFSC